MLKSLLEVTHRGITAEHYMENNRYMIWYHKAGDYRKNVGIVQVRGINKPLTKDELVNHINKLWDQYYKEYKEKSL